jgi:predicted HTH domain antitoxin
MTTITLPTDILEAARLTPDDLVREIAVMLFTQERITLEQGARLAGMGRLEFQQMLARHDAYVHYDVQDFEADLQTLRDLGRL